MPGREVRIGTGVLNLETRDQAFVRGTKRAAQQTRRLQQAQRRLQAQLRRTSAAARGYVRSMVSIRGAIVTLAGSGGIGLFIANTARAGSELQNFADQVGFSVESLQALQRAGGDWNIEADVINNGLNRFSRVVGEANQGLLTYTRIFDQLGVSINDADGNLRNTEAVFLDFANALQDVGSVTQRNQILMQAFGRQGARLGLLFDSVASQGIDSFVDSQRRAGILTQSQVDSLQSLNRAFNSFGDVLTYHRRVLVANLAKPWEDIIDLLATQAPQAFRGLEAVIRTTVIPALEYSVTQTNALLATLAAFALSVSSIGRELAKSFATLAGAGYAASKSGASGVYSAIGKSMRALTVIISSLAAAAVVLGRSFALVTRTLIAAKTQWAGVRGVLVYLNTTALPAFLGHLKILGSRVFSLSGVLAAVRSGIAAVAVGIYAVGKAIAVALLPLAKFVVIFTTISTLFQAFIDFDNTITNLRAFGSSLVNLFVEAGRFIKNYWVQEVWNPLLDFFAAGLQGLLRSIQSLFTPDNPGTLPPRVGGAARQQTERALENPLFQDTIDSIDKFREGLKDSATEASNLGEALTDVGKAWRDLVFGNDNTPVETINRVTRSLADWQRRNKDTIGPGGWRASQQEISNRELERFLRRSQNDAFNKMMRARQQAVIGDTELERFMRRSQNDAFNKTTEIYRKSVNQFDEFQKRLLRNQELLGSMQSGFENFFESILDGTAKASDAFKALAADIARAVARAFIIQPIASAISSGIGSFFNLPTPTSAQSGGAAFAGRPALVGEAGPELFIPTEAGRIVPNRDIGGSPVFNFNYEINSTDGPGVAAALATARPIFQQDAIDAVAIASQRSRGLVRG